MLMRNHQESQLLLVKEGDIYNKNLKKLKILGLRMTLKTTIII